MLLTVGATGDFHYARARRGNYRARKEVLKVAKQAKKIDLLLIVGDFTENGKYEEMSVVSQILQKIDAPKLAVLGNHDLCSPRVDRLVRNLEKNDIHVLEGNGKLIDINGVQVGVAGTTGFYGGFDHFTSKQMIEQHMLNIIREAYEVKQLQLPFYLSKKPDLTQLAERHTKILLNEVRKIDSSLAQIHEAPVRICLLHYAPIRRTCIEKCSRPGLLGSSLLSVPIDKHKPDIVFHGHSHTGNAVGMTKNEIPVVNVALPLIKNIYLKMFEVQ